MKRASPPLCYQPVSHFLLASTIALAAAFTPGCGSGPTGPVLRGNTSVTVLLTSSANDQLSQLTIAFTNITLTSQSGKMVSLFNSPQTVEFIHLNGTAEPLVTISIPQDVYTAASVTIQGAGFTCVSLLPTGGLQTSSFGPNGALTPTLMLPSPITVTGTAMGLLLDLQVGKSVTTSSCYLPDATYTLTPTFNLTPVALASPPTDFENGKETGLEGQIASIDSAANSLSVIAPYGLTWSVQTNGSTVYQGVASFSTLVAGMPVDIDAVIRSDGSLLATRVAVEDTNTANLTIWSGPLLYVSAAEPALSTLGVEQQGQLLTGGPAYFSFGNAVFQISGQFANLQSLPFAASFNATNMVAGQNIYISAHALTFAGGFPYIPAATITLIPQAINGTVSAVSTEGAFTTYTVVLAAYDLFPDLAVQAGQTTLLTNPGSVVVYVDTGTQLLNTTPLAPGSVLRFNGLLFNDSGTLRMDCGQVNDGVAE